LGGRGVIVEREDKDIGRERIYRIIYIERENYIYRERG
jgi:hypothetical protein